MLLNYPSGSQNAYWHVASPALFDISDYRQAIPVIVKF